MNTDMLEQYFYNHTKKRRQQINAAICIVAVAIIGTILLVVSRAATPYTSINADSGALTSPAIQQTCTGATDGKCVMFGSGTKLTWAPPVLSNPTTITLPTATSVGSGVDFQNLYPGNDYILKIPAGGTGPLVIDGGHNVEIIGGVVTIATTANQTDNGNDDTSTGIIVKNSSGTVHIEGVYFHSANNLMMWDAIDVEAPNATVHIENVRVDDMWGTEGDAASKGLDHHSDFIQTWGGYTALDVDHFTGNGDDQGLTIEKDLGAVGKAIIKNVSMTIQDAPSGAPAQDRTTHFLWLADHSATQGCASYPSSISFSNVYIHNTTSYANGDTTWPQSNDTHGNDPCANLSGSTLKWYGLGWTGVVTGSVMFGKPLGGDYVPTGIAGANYVSPGYL